MDAHGHLLNLSLGKRKLKTLRVIVGEDLEKLKLSHTTTFEKAASLVAQSIKNLPAMQETWV